MKTLFVWLIMLALTCSITVAAPLQVEVIEFAKANLHVREKSGKNDGPEIKRWLNYIGLDEGQPYCAAFAVFMYHSAAAKLGIPMPLPKIGRASVLYKTCQKNPYKYKVISSKRVFLGIEKLEEADLSIWSHGAVTGNWAGHVGVVTDQVTNNDFDDIEGNTGPGAKGSQREGDGVYARHRKLDRGKKFQVQGFIRILEATPIE